MKKKNVCKKKTNTLKGGKNPKSYLEVILVVNVIAKINDPVIALIIAILNITILFIYKYFEYCIEKERIKQRSENFKQTIQKSKNEIENKKGVESQKFEVKIEKCIKKWKFEIKIAKI